MEPVVCLFDRSELEKGVLVSQLLKWPECRPAGQFWIRTDGLFAALMEVSFIEFLQFAWPGQMHDHTLKNTSIQIY
ncbi:ATP synthase subunit alpha [Trichinella spiralis]|uniref:ATP synthase subunit alpha n=1 Tax=Trichinella spiralis TaxID=6334 RepID=A0ABR3K1R6_TRISP